jgi:anti-sigma factor RsiW
VFANGQPILKDADTMAPTDSRHDPPLSEADLQAYADGTLVPERMARLRDYLRNEPGEARRLAFYGRLNAEIQHAFPQTDEAVPVRVPGSSKWRLALCRLIAPRARVVAMKWFLALILALVAGSGWLAASQASSRALNNAAVMALTETVSAQLSVATPSLATLRGAPNLTSVGLRLVAERTMTLGPFAHANEFVYVNGDGQPVVLLAAPALTEWAQTQWTAGRVGDIRLLTWTAQRQRYGLAGNARTRGLMLAADAMVLH